MEGCELCNNQAKLYCESEEARLCWDCDGKVHSANFLVAKHCRTLLCNVCQKSTPWKASGSKLSPTISVCESCFRGCNKIEQSRRIDEEVEEEEEEEEEDDDDDNEDTETEDDGEYSDDGEEEDDDGENQVVPWSPSCPQPPQTSSSGSHEDEEVDRNGGTSLKRMHHPTAYLDSDEDEDGCSSKLKNNGVSMQCVTGMPPSSSSSSGYRPLKMTRTSKSFQQK